MAIQYFIRWRNYLEQSRVADYDTTSRLLTPTAFSVGRFSVEETATEIALLIEDDYALFMSSTGTIECAQFTNWVPGEFPQLEFCRQSQGVTEVIASLTKTGRLGVRNAFEGEAPPASTDQMRFFTSIAITPNGLYAATINEIGLLVEESGNYIVTDEEQLLEV